MKNTKKVEFKQADDTIFNFDQACPSSRTRLGTLREEDLLDNTMYKLFVCPALPSACQKLCGSYIGQGTTICVNENYTKAHCTMGRKDKTSEVEVEQLCIQKSKGVVFTTPILDSLVDVKLQEELSQQSWTLNEWVDLFATASKSKTISDEIDASAFQEKKLQVEKVKSHHTL